MSWAAIARAVALAACFSVGCTWDWGRFALGDGGVDAAARDGGGRDAGVDAGRVDAAGFDAGPRFDAGPPTDAGPVGVDAAPTDAGPETCRVGGFDGVRCGPQRCTRAVSPTLDRGCCEVGRCVAAPDRVLAWSEQTSGAPTIDGRQDIEYNLGNSRIYLTVVDPVSGSAVPTGTDLTASLTSVWSATHLYVLFEVIDDLILDSSATTWLDDDVIELAIDFDPTSGGAGARMVLSVNRAAPEHLAAPITTQYAARRDTMQPGYWLAEIAIPWPGGSAPSIGDAIAIDVTLHDVDTMGSTQRDRWMLSPACLLSVPAPTALMVLEGPGASQADSCTHTRCVHGGCAAPGVPCALASAVAVACP